MLSRPRPWNPLFMGVAIPLSMQRFPQALAAPRLTTWPGPPIMASSHGDAGSDRRRFFGRQGQRGPRTRPGRRSRSSLALDNLRGIVNAYALYLLHYVFIVWLQYALLGASLFAVIKMPIVFGGTLLFTWFSAQAVQRIPLGARLIGSARQPLPSLAR